MLVNQKTKSNLDHINIAELLPHRDPFLFIDQLISFEDNTLTSSYFFGDHNDFFKGHFPSFPLTPGVILCEGMMQTGAALMNLRAKLSAEEENEPQGKENKLYVASRMRDVKFKSMVKKESRVNFEVTLTESIQDAYYFSGKVKDEKGKTICSMSFTCNLTLPPNLH